LKLVVTFCGKLLKTSFLLLTLKYLNNVLFGSFTQKHLLPCRSSWKRF